MPRAGNVPTEMKSTAPFETNKVEGTDNVYVFRYGNSQAMFVVTSQGVIATDPIGYGRPQAGRCARAGPPRMAMANAAQRIT